jgi:hypothetical protein
VGRQQAQFGGSLLGAAARQDQVRYLSGRIENAVHLASAVAQRGEAIVVEEHLPNPVHDHFQLLVAQVQWLAGGEHLLSTMTPVSEMASKVSSSSSGKELGIGRGVDTGMRSNRV